MAQDAGESARWFHSLLQHLRLGWWAWHCRLMHHRQNFGSHSFREYPAKHEQGNGSGPVQASQLEASRAPVLFRATSVSSIFRSGLTTPLQDLRIGSKSGCRGYDLHGRGLNRVETMARQVRKKSCSGQNTRYSPPATYIPRSGLYRLWGSAKSWLQAQGLFLVHHHRHLAIGHTRLECSNAADAPRLTAAVWQPRSMSKCVQQL